MWEKTEIRTPGKGIGDSAGGGVLRLLTLVTHFGGASLAGSFEDGGMNLAAGLLWSGLALVRPEAGDPVGPGPVPITPGCLLSLRREGFGNGGGGRLLDCVGFLCGFLFQSLPVLKSPVFMVGDKACRQCYY